MTGRTCQPSSGRPGGNSWLIRWPRFRWAAGRSTIETAEGDKQLPDLAPLCVKSAAFPPVDGAPVLAPVKQTALDCGCGSALEQGVGNAANKGLGRR
jgi:hypothetical protein